jgi:hypothetical protein
MVQEVTKDIAQGIPKCIHHHPCVQLETFCLAIHFSTIAEEEDQSETCLT